LLATTAASTTPGYLQHGAGEELFDRPKVEILQNCSGFPVDEGTMVPLEHDATITEHAVGKSRKRFVEQDEIDGSADRSFKAGQQIAQLREVDSFVPGASPIARSVSLRSCAVPRPFEPKSSA
jgi:hypothetical protein